MQQRVRPDDSWRRKAEASSRLRPLSPTSSQRTLASTSTRASTGSFAPVVRRAQPQPQSPPRRETNRPPESCARHGARGQPSTRTAGKETELLRDGQVATLARSSLASTQPVLDSPPSGYNVREVLSKDMSDAPANGLDDLFYAAWQSQQLSGQSATDFAAGLARGDANKVLVCLRAVHDENRRNVAEMKALRESMVALQERVQHCEAAIGGEKTHHFTIPHASQQNSACNDVMELERRLDQDMRQLQAQNQPTLQLVDASDHKFAHTFVSVPRTPLAQAPTCSQVLGWGSESRPVLGNPSSSRVLGTPSSRRVSRAASTGQLEAARSASAHSPASRRLLSTPSAPSFPGISQERFRQPPGGVVAVTKMEPVVRISSAPPSPSPLTPHRDVFYQELRAAARGRGASSSPGASSRRPCLSSPLSSPSPQTAHRSVLSHAPITMSGASPGSGERPLPSLPAFLQERKDSGGVSSALDSVDESDFSSPTGKLLAMRRRMQEIQDDRTQRDPESVNRVAAAGGDSCLRPTPWTQPAMDKAVFQSFVQLDARVRSPRSTV